MTGSLQTKKGYYYVVLNYKSKNGIYMTKWISTGYELKNNKRKAESLIEQYVEQYQNLEQEEVFDGDKIPFTNAASEWLARTKDKVEKSTYEGYTIYVNKHIIPYFQKLKLYLHEVLPKHVRDYYDYKFRSGRLDGRPGGLDIQSVKKHSTVLKLMFTDAVIAELIPRNPASGVPLPKHEKIVYKGEFLTIDEANKMLQAFEGHGLQTLVYTTLYYGLRRSEALGLRWKSIDFEADKLTVDHTVVKNLSVDYKDRAKTEMSSHTFPLLADVKDLLLKLKEKQEENRRMCGEAYNDSDYVFVWQNGRLYRPDYITRAFQKVLKNYQLTKMRFHDLRHP
jgi:integrase